MKHFLVTRFNLRKSNWHTAKDGKEVLNETWLNHRFDLFENYCLPSVANQSNGDFTWLLFFDVNTSEAARTRIAFMVKNYPHFKPHFIGGFDELTPSLKAVLELEKENHTHVITSRVDNDDLLHKDYISKVQELYTPEHNTIIDLRRGVQLNKTGGATELRDYHKPYNPFLSIVESTSEVSTVFSVDHHLWGDQAAKTVVYEATEMWIELVHEKNKLNAVKDYLKKVYKVKAADYGLESDITTSLTGTLKHNFIQSAKDIVRPIFKK